MDTFCFGSGQQKKKVNFNSQVKQTKENKLKQKESKYKLFTLLRHTCTFASTAGFYPDLEIQTGSTEYFSLREYTFLQILLSSERHEHSSRLGPPVVRLASFSRARFTCWIKGASH